MNNKKKSKIQSNVHPQRKRLDIWILVLLFGALACRLALAFRFRYAISFDEAHYVQLAGSFLKKGFPGLLHPYWPPFFPFAIAIFNVIIGNLETAGRLVNIVSGCLTMLLVYRMTRELFGKKEGRISAAFAAFYPPVAFGSTNVMPEPLFSLLALFGIFLGWKAIRKMRPLLGFASGLFWGASYLVKPEGIGFLFVFFVFIVLFICVDGLKRGGWKWISAGAAAFLGFIFLATPYLIYLHDATGKWTLSSKGAVNQQLEAAVYFQDQSNPDPFFHLTIDDRHLPYDMAYHFGTLRELSKLQEGTRRVVAIPYIQYLEKYVKNFYHVVKYNVPQLFTITLFLLFAVGLTGSVYDRRRIGYLFYVLGNLAFFWFLVVPMFHVNDRYFLPLFPVCLVWVGRGAVVLSRWTADNLRVAFGPFKVAHRTGGAVVILLVLIFGFLPESAKLAAVRPDSAEMWADPVEQKQAGAWLMRHSDHPPILMSLNKAADFYSGQIEIRKGASFSLDSIDRNLAYGRYRGVEYLVFSSRYLSWFPNLSPLIEKQKLPRGLILVYESDQPAGVRTVVYRVAIADSLSAKDKGVR
jgi:4-amino-4-deoxy-L-arabinose transferase-like glycosyltransferase